MNRLINGKKVRATCQHQTVSSPGDEPTKCQNWATLKVQYQGNEKPTFYCTKHRP